MLRLSSILFFVQGVFFHHVGPAFGVNSYVNFLKQNVTARSSDKPGYKAAMNIL